MSEELHAQIAELQTKVESLNVENEALKKQLQQNGQGVTALLAQIDACKQQLNETNQASLNLRTNCILLQKQNQDLMQQLQAVNK